MRGFSITLVFGRWVKPHIKLSSEHFRFCFGFGAFSIYFKTDIEGWINYLHSKSPH